MTFDERFTPLTDAGLRPERVVIPSANPRNFHEAMSPAGPSVLLDIDGAWVFPGGDGPHPAVLVVPGSAGVSPNHLRHAVTLVREGFAVLVLDPFTSRSVTSTVANQAQFSFAASAYDVLAALRTASADARIDASRISAQGHSRGGSAVLAASMRPFADAVVGGLSLAGTYAAYPWCGQQFLRPTVGRTVVRAITGERDEWNSVMSVQAQVHAINLTGGAASMRLVPGAHHSFDRFEDVHLIAEARVSPNAPVEYLADDGSMVDPVTGVPDPSRTDIDQFRAAVAAGFGQKGARMGGGPGLPEVFDEDMIAFHRAVLTP